MFENPWSDILSPVAIQSLSIFAKIESQIRQLMVQVARTQHLQIKTSRDLQNFWLPSSKEAY